MIAATGITDPPSIGFEITIDQTTLVVWVTLIGGLMALAKATTWAIARTELYKKMTDTLDHIKNTCVHLENIEEMYENVHKDELPNKKVTGKRK